MYTTKMTDKEFLKKFGQTIRIIREDKGLSQEEFAELCNLHRTYISGIECGDRNISVSNLNQIITGLDLSWYEFVKKLQAEKSVEVREVPEKYKAKNHIQFFKYVNDKEFQDIENFIIVSLKDRTLKSRDIISKAFIMAVTLWPKENISDIWHHCIYRIYIENKKGTDSEQSWVRASGEAFELFIENQYNQYLKKYNIRIRNLISRENKKIVIDRINLKNSIGSSKIDLIVESKNMGKGIEDSGWGIVAAIHAKVSLAERVSDDIPASRALMNENIDSILITLDVKSFPPPGGDLVNRGELGSIERPSDKRKYIEEHGDFSVCFSYNERTIASPNSTKSGKKIKTINNINEKDAFMEYLIEHFCD
jgi:transcriptional regulator with XRE-family HTH domain